MRTWWAIFLTIVAIGFGVTLVVALWMDGWNRAPRPSEEWFCTHRHVEQLQNVVYPDGKTPLIYMTPVEVCDQYTRR